MSLLDLEETKASGEAPRDELYAPLVGGRDFVSERLEIDKKALEADIDLQRGRIERQLKARIDLGLIPKNALDVFQAALAVQEAEGRGHRETADPAPGLSLGENLGRGDGDPGPDDRGRKGSARSPVDG